MPKFVSVRASIPGFSTQLQGTIGDLFHLAIAPHGTRYGGPDHYAFFFPNSGERTTYVGEMIWKALDLDSLKDDETFRVYIRCYVGFHDEQFGIEIRKCDTQLVSPPMPGLYLKIASDTLAERLDFPQRVYPTDKIITLAKNQAWDWMPCEKTSGAGTGTPAVSSP